MLLPLKYLLFLISDASSLIQAVFSPAWHAILPHHLLSPHSSFKVHGKPHSLHLALSDTPSFQNVSGTSLRHAELLGTVHGYCKCVSLLFPMNQLSPKEQTLLLYCYMPLGTERTILHVLSA